MVKVCICWQLPTCIINFHVFNLYIWTCYTWIHILTVQAYFLLMKLYKELILNQLLGSLVTQVAQPLLQSRHLANWFKALTEFSAHDIKDRNNPLNTNSRYPINELRNSASSRQPHKTNNKPCDKITVQRLGRVGDESAESYPSRPAPRRVRVTSLSTQLRGNRQGRESELTRSTRYYDDNFVPHRNSMWK